VSRRLPEGEEKARAVRQRFDRIAGRYDLVNRVMTFGMDVGWRRRTVRELRLAGGALVIDLACGTGDLCRELERNGYRALGVDFSLGMLRSARAPGSFVQADILRLPVADASTDGATSGFALRNVVDLRLLFEEMARVVRPGGRIALLETSEPDNALMRAGHRVYFHRVVPVLGGMLSDREAYDYLPRSMAYLPPVDQMLDMLRVAGFADVRRLRLAGGVAQLLVGTRG
jgi:demethylmenaquinone methyltransferase / 2-methoxy-6-polyprenyl-1,4-benzoquinol methylase